MQCGATMVPDFSCCCAYNVRDEARIGDDSQAPGGLHRPQRQWERCRNASNRCAVKCKENCEFICCPLETCVWAHVKCYTGCSGICLIFRVWAKKRANLLRDKFANKVNKFKSNFQNDAETESEFRQYKEGLKRYSERLILELQQLTNRPQNSDEPANSTPNFSRKQSEISSTSDKNGNGGKISTNERKEKSIQTTSPVEVHVAQQIEASSGLSKVTSPQSKHHEEIQELPS